MEIVTLAAPLNPSVQFRVVHLDLNWKAAYIVIELEDESGKLHHFSYSNSEALSLMTTLNKANLSTKSLHRRIIEKLQADGKLVNGTITGSPD